MLKNILLASVLHLPELIDGKVCIIRNGQYKLLNPSRYTTISENFNPMNYSILIHEKYRECIVYSTKSEQVNFLINKKYKQLIIDKKMPDLFKLKDKIHIYSRRGIYEIISIFEDTIEITCKKWQYEEKKSIVISKKDFKCLAGGLHNYAE